MPGFYANNRESIDRRIFDSHCLKNHKQGLWQPGCPSKSSNPEILQQPCLQENNVRVRYTRVQIKSGNLIAKFVSDANLSDIRHSCQTGKLNAAWRIDSLSYAWLGDGHLNFISPVICATTRIRQYFRPDRAWVGRKIYVVENPGIVEIGLRKPYQPKPGRAMAKKPSEPPKAST